MSRGWRGWALSSHHSLISCSIIHQDLVQFIEWLSEYGVICHFVKNQKWISVLEVTFPLEKKGYNDL